MSVYRFRKGTLWRDDHPLALYAGSRRLSPPEVLVWWWPLNWLAVLFYAIPVASFKAIRNLFRRGN